MAGYFPAESSDAYAPIDNADGTVHAGGEIFNAPAEVATFKINIAI